MTSSIRERFAQLAETGRKAMIPYLMSGFPTRRRFLELVKVVLDEGADLLEVGMPFSDPLADGPVIQAAGQRALANGTDLNTTLEDVARLIERRPEVPRILMSYLNPMEAVGLRKLARQCKQSGLGGWIVPDRDLNEIDELEAAASEQNLDLIPLLAPTTPAARMKVLLEQVRGFVYLVTVTGVTGARSGQKLTVTRYVKEVRRHTDLPLCMGFGISGAAQAERAGRLADGAIVGSALLEPFLHSTYLRARREMVRRLRSVRRGLDHAGKHR